MELVDAILTRRSVRSYDARPIPPSTLQKILDVTRHAPSGSNREPTRLIVVQEEKRRRELATLCSHQKFVGDAPIVIAVVVKTIAYNRGNYMGSCSSLVDGAIILDHLTLVARDCGLGTCWIGSFDNERIKQFLVVPEDWNILGLTPLGYPTKDVFKTSDNRIGLAEFVMEEQWTEH